MCEENNKKKEINDIACKKNKENDKENEIITDYNCMKTCFNCPCPGAKCIENLDRKHVKLW